MTKWEYAFVQRDGWKVLLTPQEKFDIEWLRQEFPGAKIEQLGQQLAYVITRIDNQTSLAVVMIRIIEHLGTKEWEAFDTSPNMIDSGWVWFKRALP